MHHNKIISDCITPITTPLVYAMFHDFVFHVNKERVIVTPEMFGMSLILNHENRIPQTWDEVKEITEKLFPNVKFLGFVAREDSNSIQLWHDRITIYKPISHGVFGDDQLSRINWAAIGASTIEDSELFARIMAEAVYIARELDNEFLNS